MSARRSIRPSLVLGLALGGVLLGHTLTYLLLVPDAHARAAELAHTGHGYLDRANAFGVVVAVASLCAVFLGGVLRSESAPMSSILKRLAGFQLAAFAAMEILERISSGAGMSRLAPVLVVGLSVQGIVAIGIALIARLLLRVADRLAARRGHRNATLLPSPPGRAPPSVPVPA
jgi:hypothetical protein